MCVLCVPQKVGAIARAGKHQHLIIESTGISDPTPVAEALVSSDDSSNESSVFSYADFGDEDDDDSEDDKSNSGVDMVGRGTACCALSLARDPVSLHPLPPPIS